MSSSLQPPGDRFRLVWFIFAVIFASAVSVVAGLLRYANGHDIASSVITGGIAFGGALTLAIIVINFWRD